MTTLACTHTRGQDDLDRPQETEPSGLAERLGHKNGSCHGFATTATLRPLPPPQPSTMKPTFAAAAAAKTTTTRQQEQQQQQQITTTATTTTATTTT